ncbi:transcription initiation factor TFIID subunit 7-like [Amblyraja radiata]|uniref:transcription initiation factor TFIID subunit 7-like n=1 Tax=Amblyraja radiata TaxID=386614 RepID=UPI001403FEA0|nr:transcription initiation factor TFIID subunit 7-like [Amblyraja radiata]
MRVEVDQRIRLVLASLPLSLSPSLSLSVSLSLSISLFLTQYIESPDVEKEVKRLLSTDAEAVSVRWEVIAEDETKEVENQGSLPNLDSSSPGSSGHKQGHTSAVERDELREMFNDISSSSSSEDEGERHEDDDLNVLDSEEETGRPHTLEPGPPGPQPVVELQYEVEGLRQKLQLTQEKRKRQEDLIMKVENLALKNRLQAVVDEIKQQEDKEKIQLASLEAQLDTMLTK